MHLLPPLLASVPALFVKSSAAVTDTVNRYGSPVHVLFPQVFASNARAFQAVLAGFPVQHRIFYAHKANQSAAFAVAARQAGLGIDVASPGELHSALAAGFSPSDIEATGPKGAGFLRQLLEAGVIINVDNCWELQRVRELAAAPAPVLLRLSGTADSRFGISPDAAAAALDIASDSRIDLRGLSFHIDSNSAKERTAAVLSCLEAAGQAYTRGLRPRVINIGGGFPQAFSASPARFQEYTHALLAGLNDAGPALAWPGTTFGFARGRGGFGGLASFHKYGNDQPGTVLLAGLLSTPTDGQELAATLRDTMLELWLEPGKALLDNAGLTIATVEFTKELSNGSNLVNLDISRTSLCPADQEVMLDPVVCYRQPQAAYRPGRVPVFFGGNLCLERDLVTRHLTWLDRLPLPGDQVIFVNTAAYHMDLSAGTALMHPLPPKVVAHEDNGLFQLQPDRS